MTEPQAAAPGPTGPGARLTEPCRRAEGYLRPDGYVHRWVREPGQERGAHRLAHRLRWIEERGEIPDGQDVLHKCDVRWCDEITHLYLGTDLDNARDRKQRGRGNHVAGENHPMAKLTPDAVRKIRAARSVPHRVLAARFGVSRSVISHVQTGRTWRDVV